MTPLVAAGLVGLSILLIFIGLAQVLSAPSEIVDDRLQRFTFNLLTVLVMGLLGWILFRNIVLAMGAAIVGIFLPRIWLRMRQQRRISKFNDMLPDAIGLLANSLRAGYSLLQSMEVLSREMPDPIGAEFRVVIREVGLGLTEEQALKNLLERVPDVCACGALLIHVHGQP